MRTSSCRRLGRGYRGGYGRYVCDGKIPYWGKRLNAGYLCFRKKAYGNSMGFVLFYGGKVILFPVSAGMGGFDVGYLYSEHKEVFAITDVLANYFEIFSRYPANTFLNKEQRKARHHELMKWVKREYQAMPDIEEIMAFMRINDALKYEQPFFSKVVFPCVRQDLGKGNTQSLRFLFECNGMDACRIGTSRDYVVAFCNETDSKYGSFDLANMVLSNEPESEIVLFYQYRGIKRFLEYSIHEVPYGVLSGISCADKKDMPDMNKTLCDFISVSKKLCKDESHLIQKCGAMYAAWEQYLGHIENYSNFEDYLVKHDIQH